MLIGSQYSDNKLYRGIEHYDSMPLTSGDIHEYYDTLYKKNAYIMNNLLGYGNLNTPSISTTSDGIELDEPSIILIDGDVSVIQSDDDVPFVTKEDIRTAGFTEGIVCILGWYQNVTSSTTMKNYGGVDNSSLDNDLFIEKFDKQVSSRYQFRWFPILVDKSNFYNATVTLSIENRDINGNKLNTSSTINSVARKDSVVLFDKPSSLNYVVDQLYLVPIIYYKCVPSTATILSATPHEKLLTDSRMAFLQYQSIHVMESEFLNPSNITVPINVSTLKEGDIVRVIYEGLELAAGVHYTIDYSNHTATLLNFTASIGDMIYFVVTRIEESSNISNIAETFTRHMDTQASATIQSHVKLSDTVSESNASQGVAATPKLVKDAIAEAMILTDTDTGKNYKFGVKAGILYVEEV